MMHTQHARVKGLHKDHIVKLGKVVCGGAMKITATQGHNNRNGEVEGPSA